EHRGSGGIEPDRLGPGVERDDPTVRRTRLGGTGLGGGRAQQRDGRQTGPDECPAWYVSVAFHGTSLRVHSRDGTPPNGLAETAASARQSRRPGRDPAPLELGHDPAHVTSSDASGPRRTFLSMVPENADPGEGFTRRASCDGQKTRSDHRPAGNPGKRGNAP